MKKIALLGATGYIGKSLVSEFFLEKNKYNLHLFSRSKSNIKSLIRRASKDIICSTHTYDEFNSLDYDVIINCTGVGDPLVLKKNPSEIFKVTEEIDTLIINYLIKKPKTLYINLSSGAVYGDNFKRPLTNETDSILHINNMSTSEYYAIAKINSEAKHRSFSHLNIVDIRVFAFFSNLVNTDSSFLMSEVACCIKNKKVFETNEDNIIRDYSTSKDLFSLLQLVIKKRKLNDFFDVYSKESVSKFELLDFLKNKYGFEYRVKEGSKTNIPLLKKVYYSKNKKAESIGYVPEFSSLTGIEHEIDAWFN